MIYHFKRYTIFLIYHKQNLLCIVTKVIQVESMNKKLTKSRPKHCGKMMHKLYIRKGTEKRQWISVGYYCSECSKMMREIDLIETKNLNGIVGSIQKLVEKVTKPKAVVIDLGYCLTKAGVSGESKPRYIFETAVYHFDDGHTSIQMLNLSEKKRKIVKKSPIFLTSENKEELVDIAHLEIFLEHIFEKLKINPSEVSVLIIERIRDTNQIDYLKGRKSFINNSTLPEKTKEILRNEKPIEFINSFETSKIVRRKIASVLFEKFNVPRLYFSVQEILALYAEEQVTGIIVNIGASATRIVPIYEGYIITHSISIRNKGGRDVENLLTNYVLEHKTNKNGSTDYKHIIQRNIRTAAEELCFVSINPEMELKNWKNSDRYARSMNLINEKYVKLDEIRFQAPEVLFKKEPLSVIKKSGNLVEAVVESIQKCDRDLAKFLYANIILVGGGTLYEGFGERFIQDISTIVPGNIKIKVTANPNRLISGWVGGSVLSSLKIMEDRNIWVSRAEYDEKGSVAVDRCI